MLLGEVSQDVMEAVNFEQVTRRVCKEIGFDSEDKGLNCDTCDIIQKIEAQDINIAKAVHGDKDEKDYGAGDQGLMFGYATDEVDNGSFHPYSHYLSGKICEEMAIARKDGSIPWLRPDVKSQVIVEYKKEHDGKLTPLRVYNILISTQHDPDVSNEVIEQTLYDKII